MILYNHQPKMQFDFKKLKFRFIPIFNRTYDWGGYKGHIFHRSYHFIDFISSIIIWVFLKWRLLACKGILADKLLWLTVTLKYRDKKGRKKLWIVIVPETQKCWKSDSSILLKPMIGVFEDINQVERSEEKKLSENQEKIGKLERFNKSKR